MFTACTFPFLAPAVEAQDDTTSAALEMVAEGLTSPVMLAEPPDDTDRLFIVDQTGLIYVRMPDGSMPDEPFLDLSGQIVALNEGYDERGLLGLAFHPEYAENGRFFVYYSAPLREGAPEGYDHTSRLSEFSASTENPDSADTASETVLMEIDQPQGNHNGGSLAFGPADSLLYISLGDGGGANDTDSGHVEDWYADNAGGNGQDVEDNLLGSILRIDVDVDSTAGDTLYGIPEDNPFGDEQFAYGFRNPYRISFDMEPDEGGVHRLFVSDAGQELWEEVSIVQEGGNYGWNVREGAHCFDDENPEQSPEECPETVGAGHPDEGASLIDPVIEFANAKQDSGFGLVVVGGYVYRGSTLSDLDGDYIFGAWSSGTDGETRLPGQIFVAEPAAEGLWPFSVLDVTTPTDDSLTHFILSFGQDLDGEVYVLTTDEAGPTGTTGKVYKLNAPTGVASEGEAEVPERLALEQNYPNPFNPETMIRFDLAQSGPVTLKVYDAMGREVATLVDSVMPAGRHEVRWSGTNEAGLPVASGTYLYRLENGAQSDTRVMTLLR